MFCCQIHSHVFIAILLSDIAGFIVLDIVCPVESGCLLQVARVEAGETPHETLWPRREWVMHVGQVGSDCQVDLIFL